MSRETTVGWLADDVHAWYSSVMSFPPVLVRNVFANIRPDETGRLLDPFCGTGTALVEAKALGIPAIGIDCNPFSVDTSRAKTEWDISADTIRTAAIRVKEGFLSSESGTSQRDVRDLHVVQNDWLRVTVAIDAVRLIDLIERTTKGRTKRLLRLAVAWSVKEGGANVRFGPEAYHLSRKGRINALSLFFKKSQQIADALESIPTDLTNIDTVTTLADSREVYEAVEDSNAPLKWVVTSPPYPTEHDYTRIARIELELLDYVRDSNDLRRIKQSMIRANSKNVYVGDTDYESVRDCRIVSTLVGRIEARAAKKSYGFARQYPKVVGNYFGGLYRHFASLAKLLPKGSKCAYILGEQRSYLGVLVSAPDVIRHWSLRHGFPFHVSSTVTWKRRRPTRGSRATIREQIIYMTRS